MLGSVARPDAEADVVVGVGCGEQVDGENAAVGGRVAIEFAAGVAEERGDVDFQSAEAGGADFGVVRVEPAKFGGQVRVGGAGRSSVVRASPWRRTRFAYWPLWAISASWLPCSTRRPRSKTRMRSASRRVERRCAIAIVVRPDVRRVGLAESLVRFRRRRCWWLRRGRGLADRRGSRGRWTCVGVRRRRGRSRVRRARCRSRAVS